jgi:hypothetical protein
MRTALARLLGRFEVRAALFVWVAIVLGVAGGCAQRKGTGGPANPTYPDVRPCLRLLNVGERYVDSLTVMLPFATVYFGDLPAGASTVYRSFPRGIYRYAAFGFSLNGHRQIQPVADWTGERPMEGQAFTYEIALVEAHPGVPRIQMVEARRDR